jgi:hypothetical protein
MNETMAKVASNVLLFIGIPQEFASKECVFMLAAKRAVERVTNSLAANPLVPSDAGNKRLFLAVSGTFCGYLERRLEARGDMDANARTQQRRHPIPIPASPYTFGPWTRKT